MDYKGHGLEKYGPEGKDRVQRPEGRGKCQGTGDDGLEGKGYGTGA